MRKTDYLYFSLAFLFIPGTGSAASICYDEKYFPSVFSLQKTDNGIRAHLGGVYAKMPVRTAPVIEWIDGQGWKYSGDENCIYCETNSHVQKCTVELPSLRQTNQSEFIEEEPSACATNANSVYFGINFYRGEGYTGTGGIGRYDKQSKKLQIHRPDYLKDTPIHKVAYDGESIWAATTSNYECVGHPPALGLVKYDWDRKILFNYQRKSDGPCGFVIHDLLWRQDRLWVATDIGLSRWDKKDNKWTHYLPDVNNPGTVSIKSCEDTYMQLLHSLPKNEAWFDEVKSYREIFYDNLKLFRPDFIKQYELKKESASKHQRSATKSGD